MNLVYPERPTIVHPGPPHYTYAARILGISPAGWPELRVTLGSVRGVAAALAHDAGFGIHQHDGYLTLDVTAKWADLWIPGHKVHGVLEVVTEHPPTATIRTRWSPAYRAYSVWIWPGDEVISLNRRLVDAQLANPTPAVRIDHQGV